MISNLGFSLHINGQNTHTSFPVTSFSSTSQIIYYNIIYLYIYGISREEVFSLVTLFIYSRVAMLRATLRYGSLEAKKASSGSKHFTMLMQ